MIKAKLGKTIKQLRKDAGLTQEELAKKLGVSRPTISSWEVDRTDPSPDDIKKLANALNCPVGNIIGSWKIFAKSAMDKYQLYTAALSAVGWEEKIYNDAGEEIKGIIDAEDDLHIVLTNGVISFEINQEDQTEFENDLVDFTTKRLRELMVLVSQTITG